MIGEKKNQRLQLVMGDSDLQLLDQWRRLQDDLPSRSEAVRRLIAIGIISEQK